MAVIIKGRLLSAERPLVCVPIAERTREEIISRTRDLVDMGVECLEWRADFYEDLSDEKKVRDILDVMRALTNEVILLVTIRSEAQGGECGLLPQAISNLLLSMSAAHAADLIDVEFFTFEHPERLIKKLQERGALVVSSHHDFEQTPPLSVMNTLMEQMMAGDADILKLAVMPKKVSDVLDLLKVTADFHEKEPTLPIITMSMGKMGMISRISGEIFGSCMTFGSVGRLSAPGQMPREEMEQMLRMIHKYYGEQK